MMKNVLKATAALAVLAGTSGALGQVYCSSPNITAGGANPQTVMDTINVSGGPGSIVNMAVTVNVNCTWDADATLILVHNGVGLNLTNWNGGAGMNYTNTRFIDGATPITSGAPPFTGDFAPEGGVPGYFGTITLPGTFLADFAGWAGSDGNGAWDIIVDDDFPAADDVTLVNWCIDFNPGAPPPPPPPPPGDDCTTPIVATDGANPFTTVGATTDSAWSCATGGRDIHFVYTATANGTATFSTCGSAYDTAMMLGSGCGLNDYGCLDDGPCGLQQTMSKAVTTGEVVHITIGGFNSLTGSGTLTIQVVPPLMNDECTSPTFVGGEGTYPFDNTGATSNGFISCGWGGSPGYHDIWFEYVASFDGFANVSTCGQTGHDTQIGVFDGCGGNEIACNDDACATLQSQTPSFAVTTGTHYFIRISSWQNGAYGSGTFTIAQAAPPPPGDSCNDPPLVAVDGANPFDTTGTTTDGAWVCAAGGNDLHFIYTATADATYQFSTCGSAYDTAMMLGSSCGANDYGCLDDGPCGLQQTMTLAMTTGQQVHISIGGFGGAVGTGVLTISTCAPNPYNAPGGTPENEVCGTLPDIDNGGCNSTPNVFHTIACGETILGTGFFNGSTRDTDVFRFTLDTDDTVTFTGQAQFDLQLLVLDNICPWSTLFAIATTNPCNIDFTASVFLPAGTYNLWMGPLFNGQVFCGTNDSYWVTMSIGAGCAAPCDPDVNCDGSANGVDVEVQELAVGGDFTDYCQVGIPGVDDGDFNRDGAVNGTDVEAVENAVGGICP
ncbi:MAG: hypothetical protein HBSAPP03_08220 [Phycisphaerae bacterium]|nr:MAG: hypothetical protein HBSAPP03_08220 [Phycisphaerae bacterium]